MNGKKHWLRGTLLTLGLVLASASFGCVAPNDPEWEVDVEEEEDVDSATLELEEGAPPNPGPGQAANGGPDVGQGMVDDGESGEPQPVPWINLNAVPVPDGIDPDAPLSNPSGAQPSGGQSSH